GALLALLSGGFVSAPAQAGCSYGVRSHTEAAGMSAHLELLVDYEASMAMQGEPVRRPAPCSGAMCSGEPGIPRAPVRSLQLSSDPCAILELPIRTSASGPTEAAFLDSALRPIHWSPAIFHPPE